ncbi:MAG TPA: serine hydrolase domain-containing protein, partial [Pyrinomonadaceae bacterium]|nr:serine hydrolase domain-containing protein [Pyrinomonadaceae bacterium]
MKQGRSNTLLRFRVVILSFVLLASALQFPSNAQQKFVNGPTDPKELETFVDKIFTEQMEREHIPGAEFVFVKDGKVFFSKGYGFANLEKQQPVVPEQTIFRIGSISKVFTATAVVQLADRGRLKLHTDVNRYLKKLKVPATFPGPVTPAHLITHTAGFDEIRPGTQGPSAESVLPLADFLSTRLKRISPAGETVAYSTYGITLAGLLVEEVSGISFESYLANNIWKPLSMTRTSITVPATSKNELALGYEYVNGVNEPQAYEWYHTTPASSINSTAMDMARFMIAQLQNGRLGNARILTERAALDMHRQHATGHPGMPGVAYGFFEDNYQGLRILEHGGNVAGFSSQMVLLPNRNAGFFMVNHHENSNLRDTVKWDILVRYYSNPAAIKVPVAKDEYKSRAGMFAGTYRW